MSSPRNFLLFAVAVGLTAQTPAPKPPVAAPPAGITLPPAMPAATTPAVPPDKVIMTIGDEKMTAGEYELLLEALPEQVRAAARGPQKRQFAEQLVRLKIMAQEARRRKLDQNPAIQRQMELQKENLLANALFQDL